MTTLTHIKGACRRTEDCGPIRDFREELSAAVAINACNFRLLRLSGRTVSRLASLAFERGLAAIALKVHLHDRGVVHEPVDGASVIVCR